MADLFAKYNCTYCQEDITGLRVKCVDCVEFELCLQCFSSGAEIGPHKNDHAYQFVDSGAVGVSFGKSQWTAREELHLLNAIELYGFGNWEYISKHIETRTAEEAKDEYINRYLEGSIGRLTWPSAASSRPNLSDTFNEDTGPLSPTLTSALPPLDVTAEEATQLGYMPLRDDFEREYDNEAEALVSPLFINGAEDEELDIALKLVHVDIYTRRLRERARRKRVTRDYQLVTSFFNTTTRKDRQLYKKKPTKEEKELSDSMRVVSQFHTAAEHEQFLFNMQRQQELKVRLRELQRYRQHGLTRHEECMHFEQELLMQQEVLRHKQSGVGSSVLGTNLSPSTHSYSSGQLGMTQLLSRKKERNEDLSPCSTARRFILRDLGLVGAALGSSQEAAEGGVQWQPDSLLSSNESQLCSTLDIMPTDYISLKAVLLMAGAGTGCDSPTGVESRVSSYLETTGWLPRLS